VTRYAVVEALRPQGLSLLALWPETGRTHQLRVQAATRGLPIAGDERYGDFLANRYLALEAGLKRMFLHAQRVELRHPVTGHKLRLEARLSRKLVESLAKARALERQVPRRR
jgi:23S rRNA pseudouridine955/2504/2580 synthase